MNAGTGIYTPGSIWAKALEHKKTQKKSESGREDSHVYVVGPKGSGKSTLLSRFLYPNKLEVPKPSQALEYTFARKASNLADARKDLAHIWEASGSEAFAQQLVKGNQIFLTYRQVTTAVVIIVLDLSDPAAVLPSALQWLDLVKRKLSATYSLYERKGLQVAEHLRTRQQTKLFSQHEDKDSVSCSGISIVLAATKWDSFMNSADPEVQRVLARSLRWLAHSNAAHLVYLGGLQPGGSLSSAGAGASGVKGQPQQLIDNFSRLLNHLVFVGIDRKMPLKLPPQFDHLQPLMVPAGHDKFRDIGMANMPLSPSPTAAEIAAGQQDWVAAAQQLFPNPKPREQRETGFVMDARYHEEDVDNARARREAALEAYKREVEAIRRQEALARKQKAAATAAGPGAAGTTPVGTAAVTSGQQHVRRQRGVQ